MAAPTLTIRRTAVLLAFLLPVAAFAAGEDRSDAVHEGAFLDVLPAITVPADVQPIPGAVNVAFRTCEAFWPAGYRASQAGPEARAYRDIYGYVKAAHVINTRNCSCAGKIANWAEVELIADRIRTQAGTSRLTWQDTRSVFEESNALLAVAETLCGGPF